MPITPVDFKGKQDIMKITKFYKNSLFIGLLSISLVACMTKIPEECLTLSPEALADRQLQSRVFETGDEIRLLTAGAAVLQDLGFTIDESETKCGVIVASRDRDVLEAGQVVLAIFVAAFTGAVMPIDSKQKVMASLVTKPIDANRVSVRVTFQHMVWDTNGGLRKNEQMHEPEVYQEFFSKLSKSVFLTAYEI